MREINYKNYNELLNDIEEDLYSGADVAVYAIGEDAETVIKGLLDRLSFLSIAFLDYNALDYHEEEYCIAIVADQLFVSPAKDRKTDEYLYTETDVCYVNGDCSSLLLPNIHGYKIIYNMADE